MRTAIASLSYSTKNISIFGYKVQGGKALSLFFKGTQNQADFRTGKDWISFCKQRNRNGMPHKKLVSLMSFIIIYFVVVCSVYAI